MSLGSRPAAPTASWKIGPIEAERLAEKGAEGWWQRAFGWIFLAIGAVMLLWMSRTEPTEQAHAMVVFKALVLVAVSQIGLVYLLFRQSNEVDLGPGLKRVRAKLPVEDAAPHRISLYQRGTMTGADEGFIWFDEGTFFFKGLQCAFRLNTEDVLEVDKWPRRDQPREARDVRTLHVIAPPRDCRLVLKPIDPFEDYASRRRAHRFQVQLVDWLMDRPAASMESVLPPLEVHPSLLKTLGRSREGLATGSILTLFNVYLATSVSFDFSLGSLYSLASLAQFLAALGLLFLSVRFTWQQYTDLVQRRSIFLENELSPP